MNKWRNTTAVALVICVSHLTLLDSLNAANSSTPASIRQQMDQYGVGAKIRLKLGSGEKLQGAIGAIEDHGFLISSKPEKLSRRVDYDQVAQLQLANRRYHASGQPDPIEARRVALALGVGKHVVVKTSTGAEYHGHLQAIEEDHLMVLPDHQPVPVQVAYGDVRHLEKNLSLGATIVLVVLIGAALIVTAAVLATKK
jgi:small nuclear ribonucleoprotein (snRNP)-like protein